MEHPSILKAGLGTFLLSIVCFAVPAFSGEATPERQASVAQRGAEVMPFSLNQTLHVFERTDHGGIQKVVAKQGASPEQVALIRKHLEEIQREFSAGDFSGPSLIHGDDMPGLKEIKEAKAGEIVIKYEDIKDGAQLQFSTDNPDLVHAIHSWIGAQLNDHGHHAMEAHSSHHLGVDK